MIGLESGRTPTYGGGGSWGRGGSGDLQQIRQRVIAFHQRGKADAVETPIGFVPTGTALDLTGLDLTHAHVEDAVRVDRAEWDAELASIEEWYAKFGDSLPDALRSELEALKERMSAH